jgi:hypothetical protein
MVDPNRPSSCSAFELAPKQLRAGLPVVAAPAETLEELHMTNRRNPISRNAAIADAFRATGLMFTSVAPRRRDSSTAVSSKTRATPRRRQARSTITGSTVDFPSSHNRPASDTYNRGCRCDDCREAARQARARQRAAQRVDNEPLAYGSAGVGTGPIAVVAVAAGGVLVWRATSLRRQDQQRHTGLMFAGVALLVAGLILAASC